MLLAIGRGGLTQRIITGYGDAAKGGGAMEMRTFGRSGLTVSALGFGCGAVGGLMVRGEPADQERAVVYAVEHGVTFFDTAPGYGDGRSETNLGRVLAKLRPEITLATRRRPLLA